MTAVLKTNEELNGIELYFASKPNQSTLTTLKSNGFRWSNFKKCWYTKQSEKAFKVAENFTSNNSQGSEQTQPTDNVSAPKKEKSLTLSLWKACQFEEMKVEVSNDTKQVAKEIRSHLRKRFPQCKFSITSTYSKINADIKSSPYEEGSIYLESIKQYCNDFINNYKHCYDAGDPYTDLPASYNFYFFGIDTHYDYQQTETTAAHKEDMKQFDIEATKAERAKQEEEDKAFQEYLAESKRKEEEYKKFQEEEKKKEEQIYNDIKEKELSEDNQYFILNAQFANLNKNETLLTYKEEVLKGEYSNENVQITKELHFSSEEALKNFSNMLMNSFDFLANTGGSYTNDNRINSMEDFYNMDDEERYTVQWNLKGVAVYHNNKLQFVIDAQGHDYARYVGLTNNATIQKTLTDDQVIDNEELTQLQYDADVLEDISVSVISELDIFDTWKDTDWKQYKEALKVEMKRKNFKLSKQIIQQIETDSLKPYMYKILSEVDGIQDQFTNANLQPGEKLTLFYISDFGSIVTSRITLDSITPTKYAQYDNAIKLTFTPERKRKLHYSYFYSTLLVYKGHHHLPQTVLNEVEENGAFRTVKSKYHSCDKKQYDEILNYFNQSNIKPVINTHRPQF